MHCSIPLTTKLTRSIITEHTVLSVLLSITALLLSYGFFTVSSHHDPGYILLERLTSFYNWGILFGIYGISKFYTSMYRNPGILKVIVSISGLWLWSYLIISNVLLDHTTADPTEYMLFMTVICEVWTLTVAIYYNTHKLYRRLNDAPI